MQMVMTAVLLKQHLPFPYTELPRTLTAASMTVEMFCYVE